MWNILRYLTPRRIYSRRTGLWGVLIAASLTTALLQVARAEPAYGRLFIQIWWDAQPLEMDPSDDPGRIEVSIGDTFVGCAIAPSHINYRKQLMIVPPSLGFAATGDQHAVQITVTGELAKLKGRQVKITEI